MKRVLKLLPELRRVNAITPPKEFLATLSSLKKGTAISKNGLICDNDNDNVVDADIVLLLSLLSGFILELLLGCCILVSITLLVLVSVLVLNHNDDDDDILLLLI